MQNVLQGLQAGQGLERQRLVNTLGQQAGQAGFDPATNLDFQRLTALDPQRAASTLDTFNQLGSQRKQAYFDDMRQGRKMLESGDTQGALQLFSNRLDAINQIGGDVTGTQMVLSKIAGGDIEETIQGLKKSEEAGVELGFLSDVASKAVSKDTRTANQKDFDTFQRLLVDDPKKAIQFGRATNFIRPTEQESSDIKVKEAERKAIAKASTNRKQGFIDNGIQAADSLANMNRALTLIDKMETGGIDKVALDAKRLFGVESADEGELTNLMGKSVLAQLKPLFGGAFTKAEADQLLKIENGLGKSAKANKRLIENAIKISNRAARRGLAAAEDMGEHFTANEIREAMAFDLSEKLEQPQQEAQVNQQPQQQATQVLNFDAQGNLIP